MMLMVTSSWHHRMVHPRGLVPKLKGRRCQSRGDWSQRMASLSSECDSNTFVGEEMRHQLSHYFSSLTTDMNRVPTAQEGNYYGCPGVRPLFFASGSSVNSLSSPVNGNSEERWSKANVGVHLRISTKASSTSSELLYYSQAGSESVRIAAYRVWVLYTCSC